MVALINVRCRQWENNNVWPAIEMYDATLIRLAGPHHHTRCHWLVKF